MHKYTVLYHSIHHVHSVIHTVHIPITRDAQCTQFYNTQCHNIPHMYALRARLYNAMTLHSQVDSVITQQSHYTVECALYTVCIPLHEQSIWCF